MPKLMIRIIMSLGAFLLSTAPISQTFAQVKQQEEAQASGVAVEDTLSNSSDNLQLLRPDATTIFPKGDSIPVADSAPAVPAAKMSSTVAVVVVLLVIIGALLLLLGITSAAGGCCL